MSLFQEWKNLINNQTEDTFENFWKKYSDTETKIYKSLLADYKSHLKGDVASLVEKFDCDKVIFVGFLNGINDSLHTSLNLENITEDTELDLDVDFEKLFFNMLKADADYLFTLEEWEEVLTEEQRLDIVKDFKKSKIVHVEKKPGRNDPCPCGSGKKYKKCCGSGK